VVCVLISTGRGVFIGVQGRVTNLVKLVTHQEVADRPSHVVFANHSKSFICCSYVISAFTYHIVELVFVLSYIRSCV
jgi:hypothetical protein